MKVFNSRLFFVQGSLTAGCVVLGLLFGEQILTPVAVAGLMLVGIPHGANDILFRNQTPFSNLGLFLMLYILIMGLYALLWYWLPGLALLIFLAFSVHHFGQTIFENQIIANGYSIAWGLLFILLPIAFHPEAAFETFSVMMQMSLKTPNSELLRLGTLAGIAILVAVVARNCSPSFAVRHAIQWLLIISLIWLAPLIQGFLLLFVIWHALPSMRQQHQMYLFQPGSSSQKFFGNMALYTLAAAAMLWGVSVWLPLGPGMYFILLSLITLPHVLVIHRAISIQPG
jgi:Brp/Blh family beta-carotene 15,15'-monooxygenase